MLTPSLKNIAALIFSSLFMLACQDQTSTTAAEKESIENPASDMKSPEKSDGKTILFFGNSITEGYQLEQSEAFPALIQQKLDSLQLDYTTINAGLSGETSSGGVGRVKWVLNQQVDIFVLELGANDGLRGINPEETNKNLRAIIETVVEKNAATKILLCGMMVPPNMGPDYGAKFKEIFPSIAKDYEVTYLPFLLDGVAGIPELNLQDGIHPTPEGHKIVAQNIWEKLEPML